MKALWKLVFVALAITLLGAACSGSANDSAETGLASESASGDDGDGSSGDDASGDDGGSDDGSSSFESEAAGQDEMASSSDSGNSAAATSANINVGPESVDPTAKIIFEADVVVESDDVAATANRVSDEARKAGGFIADQRVTLGETGRASLTIRVPAGEFDGTLNALRGLGTTRSVEVTTDDVSLEFVDIVARSRTMEESLIRVQGLLSEAADTDAILRLEREIADRQGQLDSLIGRRNFLENRVELSTIRLTVVEAVELDEAPVVEAEDDEPGFSDGLDGGVEAFLSVARVLMISLGAVLPFLPFVIVGGFLWSAWRRRREARRSERTTLAHQHQFQGGSTAAPATPAPPAAPSAPETAAAREPAEAVSSTV